MDCVRAKLPEERNALFSCEFFVKKNYDVLSPNMAALSGGCPKYLFPELRCLLHCYLCIFSRVSHPKFNLQIPRKPLYVASKQR